MIAERLERLAAIDPAKLTEIVRRAQVSETFELDAWEVRRLSDKGGVNPEGLFLFSGSGRDQAGARSWAVVLKWIKAGDSSLSPDHLWHWRREYSAMESGLLRRMPGPLAAPQCFGLEEQPDGAWMWIEHIVDRTPRRWGTAEFAFAADKLGKTTGAWLASNSIPDEPWLCRAHALPWAETFPPAEAAWDDPYVRAAWPDSLRERFLTLWSQRARLGQALAALPQTFAHLDSQRRNLMIRTNTAGQDELVAVDWAWCGLGPVGEDAAILLGNSLLLREANARDATVLDQAIFPAYLAGLKTAGWTGEAGAVRAAYCASHALFCCSAALAFSGFCTQAGEQEVQRQFGLDVKGCVQHYADLARFAVDQGDEAFELLSALGM